MKQITIYFFAITTFIASCSSCKKETIPEFYYHCKLNGIYYVPFSSSTSDLQCNIIGDTNLICGAYIGGGQSISIGIILTKPNYVSTGSSIINTKQGYGSSGLYRNQPYIENYYYADSNHLGLLEITELDKTNKVIAGTFHFDAYCAKYDSTVHITEGAFRLKYKIY